MAYFGAEKTGRRGCGPRLRQRQAGLAGVAAAGSPAPGGMLAEPIRFGNGNDEMQGFPLIFGAGPNGSVAWTFQRPGRRTGAEPRVGGSRGTDRKAGRMARRRASREREGWRIGRAAAVLAAPAMLAGCAGAPFLGDPPDRQEILDRGLPIARAALGTGQLDTAQRLYRALAEQVNPAPEPHLGLGRIHLAAGDWRKAFTAFGKAEARSRDRPDMLLEARIGIARSQLLGGDWNADEDRQGPPAAGRWNAAEETLADALRDAEGLDPLPRGLGAAWGLMAVVRDHAGDRQGAGEAMRKALAASPADPALWANAVAMRARHGDLGGARSLLASRPDEFWLRGDKRRLERLLGEPVTGSITPALRLAPGGEAGSLPAPAGPEGDPWTPRLQSLGLPGPARPAPPAPAPVRLTLGQTRSITLAEPATAVVVVRDEVADVHLTAPDALYVLARGPGQTQIGIDLEGGERVHTTLTVVQDPAPVQAVLDTLDEGKRLKAVGLPYAISIRGAVPSPETAQWVLKRVAGAVPAGVALDDAMQLEGPLQVELEVQIAEVQRTISERLGINWGASRLDRLPADPRKLRIGTPFPGTIAGTFADNLLNSTSALDVAGHTEIGAFRFDVLIQALASAGLANVLAQPTLTALSGEEASFHAGGEIPVLSGEKDDRLEYTYRELGVILGFVPTVISEDRIGISVRAEVKEEDESRTTNRSLPFLTARKAHTTVEVGNGESFVIAGLFSTGSERSESGVPLLKDLPAVGLLFGQTLTSAEERELIITVTARLVHPDRIPEEGEAPVPLGRTVNGYYV